MWFGRSLGRHKWKLIGFGCMSIIPVATFGDEMALWGILLFLLIGFTSISIGIVAEPAAPEVFGGNKHESVGDFTLLLDSLTLKYMYDLDYKKDIDFVSRDTVSKYKALPKAPAESIAKLYGKHLVLIKSNMGTRVDRMSMTELERSLVKELERSIDIQYKYHVEQNLRDEITALHNMNNHYADMLGYTDKEPK